MVRTLRVLLVEDSEDDALLLLRELRRSGYEPDYERVDTAPGMEAALDRLRQHRGGGCGRGDEGRGPRLHHEG
jgi:CheY-like chemotaxis protein